MSTQSLFRPEAVAHNSRRLAGEVVLATPLPSRLVGLVLAAVVFSAGIFAAFATYARTAGLNGWLVPDRGLIRAAAPTAGIIQSVLVREGDLVEPGQRLAEITLAAETSEGNASDSRALGLRQEGSAASSRKHAILARLQAESEQTRVRIANYQRELTQIETQIEFQRARLKLAASQAGAAEKLAGKGLLPTRDLEQRQSALLAIDLELAGLRRQAVAIEREISDGHARLAAIPIEVQAAEADYLSVEASLKQKTTDAEMRRAVFVVAPMGGKIAALPVSTGQPVTAGGTLAVLTPADGRLEAELLAPSRAIGFIREGQPVRLQLQAFPYQRFGTLEGTVSSVSGTVIAPADVSIPGLAVQEPVFRVRVSLASEHIVAYGEAHALQPGMLLTAEVVLDRQNLIRWLFDPLYAVSRKL